MKVQTVNEVTAAARSLLRQARCPECNRKGLEDSEDCDWCAQRVEFTATELLRDFEAEALRARQQVLPPVLDACCGPRMMWFDSKDRRALFIDERQESHPMNNGPRSAGRNPAVIAPDIVADFTALPFPDESFFMVAFDPPHIRRGSATGYLVKKYGRLPADWQEMLRRGFAECFRVLKPHGTLVFKWAETNFTVAQVLELAPHAPLFGSRRGRSTHWFVFMKPAL